MPQETRLAPNVLEILESADLHSLNFWPSSVAQAAGMAERVGIDISKDELLTYCFLRESDIKGSDPDYLYPAQLSDQVLFGEVLLIFGRREAFDKLVETYPNIFD